MRNRIFVTFILFFCLFGRAEAMNYFNFLYQVKSGDTLSSILKKFVKNDSQIIRSTPLVGKIMEKNIQVKDWINLEPGIILQMYISPDFFDYAKYRKFEIDNLGELKKEIEKVDKVKEIQSGWKGSAYYMYSTGTLNQENDGAKVSSSRNSPITLGLSLNYLPLDKRYSLSASFYGCLLTNSNSNINSTVVADPVEVGATLYGEYRFLNKNFNLYSGLDFETLSSYSLSDLLDDQKIYVENSKIMFVTVGISNFFTIYNLPFFTKFSFSKSILSTYDDVPGRPSASLKYSGYKTLFYLNYKFTDKLFLHSMIKYHTLSGPSDLSVLRVGLGVGFILF